MSWGLNIARSLVCYRKKSLDYSLNKKLFPIIGAMRASNSATGNATKISCGSTQKRPRKLKNVSACGSRNRLFPEEHLSKLIPFLFVETQAQYVRDQFGTIKRRVVR